MSKHELPAVLTADDQERIEKTLTELPDSSDGPVALSVFLPAAKQTMVILAQDGDILSWCLMPARDQEHANALTGPLKEVLRHELESVCGHARAMADALIARASRAPDRSPR